MCGIAGIWGAFTHCDRAIILATSDRVLQSRGRFRELRMVPPLIPQPERALVATRAWLDGAVELDPSIIPDDDGLHGLEFGAVAAAATGQWDAFDAGWRAFEPFRGPMAGPTRTHVLGMARRAGPRPVLSVGSSDRVARPSGRARTSGPPRAPRS